MRALVRPGMHSTLRITPQHHRLVQQLHSQRFVSQVGGQSHRVPKHAFNHVGIMAWLGFLVVRSGITFVVLKVRTGELVST
jgi:hypothetical protein